MKRYCLDCKKKLKGHGNPFRCKSCANSGKNNPMYGKENMWGHHNEQTKKKLGLIHKGKKLLEETKRKISEKLKGKGWKGKKLSKEHIKKIVETRIKNNSYTHTLEQRKLLSIKMSGENGCNWKGGITPLNKILRGSSKWKIWREFVFLRDNFTCQNFNCPYCHNKVGGYLHPHHIKPIASFPELAFRVDNGITYCAEFHLKSGLHKNIMQKES